MGEISTSSAKGKQNHTLSPAFNSLVYYYTIKVTEFSDFLSSIVQTFRRHCFHPQHMCTKKSYFLVSSTMFHHDHGATFSNPPYPSIPHPDINYYCQIPTPRGALTRVKCLGCTVWEGNVDIICTAALEFYIYD